MSAMHCPSCRRLVGTRVIKTESNKTRTMTTRLRECEHGYTFETVEIIKPKNPGWASGRRIAKP